MLKASTKYVNKLMLDFDVTNIYHFFHHYECSQRIRKMIYDNKILKLNLFTSYFNNGFEDGTIKIHNPNIEEDDF